MMEPPECCGHRVKSSYCPICGRRQFERTDPQALLNYLKGQRGKTQAWMTRCQRHLASLSEVEREARLARHRETVKRWDAWIAWVEARLAQSEAKQRATTRPSERLL